MDRYPPGFVRASALTLILAAGSILAADRNDGGAAGNNPLADILDLYAFTAPLCQMPDTADCPQDPEELILVLTVNPQATGATQFSPDLVYRFHLENESGVTVQIDCSFSSEQVVTCAGLDDLSVQSRVGETARNGDIRVFSGLRDDPFFFDRNAFANLSSQGLTAFTLPGEDYHAGSNVLALVLGVRISALPANAGSGSNVYKVWASSEGLAVSGINGAITGAWYNPDQPGQGWLIEVVSSSSGQDQFVVYFYGYDSFGEQLWLLGAGPDIVGDTATVEVLRTHGVGFGSEFDPLSFAMEPFGTMAFTFHDCNSGEVEFFPVDGEQLEFTSNITRLTQISNLECRFHRDGQIDRMGRPLVADFFVSEAAMEAYNTSADPDRWAALFTDEIAVGIGNLDAADGVVGNLFTGDPRELAALFVDDRLQIDVEKPNCSVYGAVEVEALTGQPSGSCGGRTPFYDVVDNTLGLVVTGFDPDVHDFVNWNDAEFLMEFPFLAAPHGPSNFVSFEWPESTPSAQGLDPTMVQSLYHNASAIGHLYSLLLIKNGYLVAEQYFNGMDPSDANYVASVTKSVTSALIGIALEEGALSSLDQKLAEFFPEIDWDNLDPRKGQITVRQLLQMRSGYPWEERTGDLQTIQDSLNLIPLLEDFALSATPGTQFNYSNLSSHMLSVILQRVTGESAFSLASTRLFNPLGTTLRYWPRDGLGYYLGSHGIHLRPRDLAKFGQLYLDGGMFNGRRVLSGSWVSESFQTHSAETFGERILTYMYPLRYGYQWWASTAGNYNFNYAWGHGGQLVVVLDELDLVIVTTAGDFGGLPGELTWQDEKKIHDLVGEFISQLP